MSSHKKKFTYDPVEKNEFLDAQRYLLADSKQDNDLFKDWDEVNGVWQKPQLLFNFPWKTSQVLLLSSFRTDSSSWFVVDDLLNEQEPEPEPDTKQKTSTITGWQQWRLMPCDEIDELHLHSVQWRECWDRPTMTADKVPAWDGAYFQAKNGCSGIHINKRSEYRVEEGIAIGRCEVYGTVIEHETGYRAEHVVIKDLYIPRTCCECRCNMQEVADNISSRYDCEVILVDVKEEDCA